ncbi:hypothetical protein [Bacillus tuaregi]|uniref:hypothetical protein n=1 Tax=Bacillus tuaregi TaxID=1816695 RepID=UPI0008F84D55|nr:hypothetical protein [Bacillus tuaregi]
MGMFHHFFKGEKREGKKRLKNELMIKDVDHYFGYLLTIFNDFSDKYSENEKYRHYVKPQSKEYLNNLEHGIQLTKKAYDKINALPYVYNLPKATQQYIKSSKEQYLMTLENYMKQDEAIRDHILAAAKAGKKLEISEELTIPYAVKAQFHMESATNYMEQARQSV